MNWDEVTLPCHLIITLPLSPPHPSFSYRHEMGWNYWRHHEAWQLVGNVGGGLLCMVTKASLRSEKVPLNIDIYRGLSRNLVFFWDHRESLIMIFRDWGGEVVDSMFTWFYYFTALSLTQPSKSQQILQNNDVFTRNQANIIMAFIDQPSDSLAEFCRQLIRIQSDDVAKWIEFAARPHIQRGFVIYFYLLFLFYYLCCCFVLFISCYGLLYVFFFFSEFVLITEQASFAFLQFYMAW